MKTSPKTTFLTTVFSLGWVLLAYISYQWWPKFSIIKEIHADSLRVYPPGEVTYDYWGAPWDSIRFDPFQSFNSLSHFALIIPYLLAVAAVGQAALRFSRISQQLDSNVGLIAASFLTGYVLVLPFIRLTFFLVPISAASKLSYSAIVFGGVFCMMFGGLSQWQHRLRLLSKSLTLFTAFAAISLIYRIQSGRNFLVSDSLIVFLDQIRAIKLNPTPGYLPTWDQHSDEWIFNAPGFFLSPSVGSEALWTLATNAFGFAALVIVLATTADRLLKGIKKHRFVSWSSVAFAVLGTTAAIPVLNISLIGGQNPLVYLGHMGRYVGIVAPLLGFFLAYDSKSVAPHRSLLLLAGLSLGFAFLSPQTFFYFLIAVALGAMTMNQAQQCQDSESTPLKLGIELAPALLPLLAVVTGVIVYGSTPMPAPLGAGQGAISFSPIGFLLLMPLALWVCWIFTRIVRSGFHKWFLSFFRPISYRYFVAILSFFVGLLISGNLLSESAIYREIAELMKPLLPGLSTPILSRGVDIPLSLSEFGKYGGLQCWISVHCSNSSGFILAVSFPLLLACFAGLLAGTNGKKIIRLLGFLAVSSAVFLLSAFFLTDFTGGEQLISVWGKTRFLETPLYLMMFISILVIGRFIPRLVSAIALLWTLPTTIVLIPQFYANLTWLISKMI